MSSSAGILAIASTVLSTGNLVNLFYSTVNSTTGICARSASANANTIHPAVGYITTNANVGDIITIYPTGIVNIPFTSGFSYSDIGSSLYLSDSIPGAVTKTPPTSPNLTQSVGFITNLENNPVSSVDLYFNTSIIPTANTTPTPNANITPSATLTITTAASGNISYAHGLNATPSWMEILMTSNGSIWAQSVPFDSANVNLVASDIGLTSIVYVFE